MRTKHHTEMNDTIESLFKYATQPFTQNTMAVLVLSVIANAVAWTAGKLMVDASFLVIWILLTLGDWLTGVLYIVVDKNETFRSTNFFKKIMLIGFCMILIFANTQLIASFVNYPHQPNSILDYILGAVIFLLELTKVILLMAFIVYELTSLRENFIKLKWHEYVSFLDIFLVPIQKLQNVLQKRFNNESDNITGENNNKTSQLPEENQ